MKKKGVLNGIIICTAIIAIGIAAYFGYVSKSNSYATNSVYVSLAETATQQKFNIKQELSPDILLLTATAKKIAENNNSLEHNGKLLLDLFKRLILNH